MTEKRFTFNDLKVLSDETILNNLRVLSAESVLKILNQLVDENEHLKKQYNNLFDELDSLAEVNDKFYKEKEQLKLDLKHIQDSLWTTELINNFKEKIEQLQARNDRQAKQLGNLYNLIENEDWKTLKGIIQEFKEGDERLQKEYNYEVDMND